MEQTPHIPVLMAEVLQALACQSGGVFIDGTFGAGGYTTAILKESKKNHVIGFDRDPESVQTAMVMEEKYKGRFSFVHDCFGNMANHVSEKVDGIVLDLGVSSMQIDQADRGFSFRLDGPLDMRMGKEGVSAKDVVNGFKEKDIADIIFKYGEEKASRRIAAAIVKARAIQPITTTSQLAEIIHSVMPRPKDGSDSAMRSFQALRIFVNDELGELERALEASIRLLKADGRLVVVTFHSLEDRIVKNFLIRHAGLEPHENRHVPMALVQAAPLFRVITKKPVTPSAAELERNPRSRSSKLRAGIRQGESA